MGTPTKTFSRTFLRLKSFPQYNINIFNNLQNANFRAIFIGN